MSSGFPKTEEAPLAEIRLTVLGTRGSMAVRENGREIFGGATSCYMLQAGDACVFLDAGSGLLDAPVRFPKPPLILLTHLHLDHLLGLGMYRRLSMPGEKTLIRLPAESDEEARKRIDTLFSPPYWPLKLTQYQGDVDIARAVFPMQHGKIRIEAIPGEHPGDCVVLKASCGDKSLVYATDYEYEEKSFSALAAFAQGVDLLLYDGQYSEEELLLRKGFGHSSAATGIELMERCGAKRMLLIHHDPQASDRVLLERERQLAHKNVRYARAGEVITL
jgi:ribonuclease BN (tRNA processing enzyme)